MHINVGLYTYFYRLIKIQIFVLTKWLMCTNEKQKVDLTGNQFYLRVYY